MDFVYLLLGLVSAVILLINIKNAADIICRFAGGFILLIIYNTIAAALAFPPIGVNAVSASLCGLLGIPGGLMLVGLSVLF